MKLTRFLLAIAPIVLLCSCATSGRKVIATKHTTLQKQTIIAEYPVTITDTER